MQNKCQHCWLWPRIPRMKSSWNGWKCNRTNICVGLFESYFPSNIFFLALVHDQHQWPILILEFSRSIPPGPSHRLLLIISNYHSHSSLTVHVVGTWHPLDFRGKSWKIQAFSIFLVENIFENWFSNSLTNSHHFWHWRFHILSMTGICRRQSWD